jgi:hypothetical protein
MKPTFRVAAMTHIPTGELIARSLRTSQITHLALVSGVLIFLGIAFLVVRKGSLAADPWSPSGVLTLTALAYGSAAIVLSVVIPRFARNSARAALKDGRWTSPGIPVPADPAERETMGLLMGLQTSLIIRLALLEGAALLATIALMIEGKALSLVLVLVLLFLMVMQFPTSGSLEQQLETERALLRD